MNDQLEVLRDLVGRLERLEIPYMISGSMAVAYYAQPRMTRDIDLVVELQPSHARRLVEALQPDYYIDGEAVREAIARRDMFNALHLARIVKVDFIVRKDHPYRRMEFARRRQVKMKGLSVTLVSPEDLILSKLDWARESLSEIQLRDVRILLQSVEDLDWDYLRRWAEELRLTKLLREMTG